jgi:glycosyltransferase involved in cell wall biosynthesis
MSKIEQMTTSQQSLAKANGLAPTEDRYGTLERLERSLQQLENLENEIRKEIRVDDEPLGYTLPTGFLLSVIVPVYNEVATIGQVLSRLAACPIPMEIVVIDDASTDGTRNVLELWQSASGVRIIFKERNAGKGAAIRSGLSEARGAVILVQDADLEYDPRDIPALIKPIVRGEADIAYGSRFIGYDRFAGAWWQALANRTLTFFSNRLTGARLTDMETGYKAFTRESILGIHLTQDRFGFEPEVTAKLARRGYRFTEMPVRYTPRSFADGKKIRLKDAFFALYAIVRFGLGD